jgi:hypothetical protein
MHTGTIIRMDARTDIRMMAGMRGMRIRRCSQRCWHGRWLRRWGW